MRAPPLVRVIKLTARATVSAALVGTVTAGVFAIMEYGLWYHEEKISRAELYELVWKQLSVGTAVGISIVGIIAGLVILFPPLMAVMSAMVLPLTFANFAFVGYQFYVASAAWKEAGFEPLLGAWDTTKEIAREAWERAATLFEKFQNASKIAWTETKETAHEVWDFIHVGADGITVDVGTALRRVLDWLRITLPPGVFWD